MQEEVGEDAEVPVPAAKAWHVSVSLSCVCGDCDWCQIDI